MNDMSRTLTQVYVYANWLFLDDPAHRAALKAELTAARVPARRVIVGGGAASAAAAPTELE